MQTLLERFRRKSFANARTDTHRGQGRILAFLAKEDGLAASDLAYLLDIRVSSLNELLAKLEKNGYITREPSEADKRIPLVKITEAGKGAVSEAGEAQNPFDALSDDEKEAFSLALDKVIENLKAQLGTGDGDDADLDERFIRVKGRMMERFHQRREPEGGAMRGARRGGEAGAERKERDLRGQHGEHPEHGEAKKPDRSSHESREGRGRKAEGDQAGPDRGAREGRGMFGRRHFPDGE